MLICYKIITKWNNISALALKTVLKLNSYLFTVARKHKFYFIKVRREKKTTKLTIWLKFHSIISISNGTLNDTRFLDHNWQEIQELELLRHHTLHTIQKNLLFCHVHDTVLLYVENRLQHQFIYQERRNDISLFFEFNFFVRRRLWSKDSNK